MKDGEAIEAVFNEGGELVEVRYISGNKIRVVKITDGLSEEEKKAIEDGLRTRRRHEEGHSHGKYF